MAFSLSILTPPHLGDIQTSVTNNIFEFIGNVNY